MRRMLTLPLAILVVVTILALVAFDRPAEEPRGKTLSSQLVTDGQGATHELVLLPTGLCGLVFDCTLGAPRATVDPGKLVFLPTGLCAIVFDCSKGFRGAGG